MIIPSIDIEAGEVVQLIGGKYKALSAGAPEPLVKKFRVAGEIAVIDLDAARGRGSNARLIKPLLRKAPLRIGGGIRTKEAALDWLDAGAEKVILGTAATPELLKELPKERIIAALDSVNGKIVVEGWEKATDDLLENKISELKPFVSGFLITFVESEGRLTGIDMERVQRLIRLAAPLKITFAGGISSVEEIKKIHELGADAQVGMALYTGRIALGDAVSCVLPENQLWPTVVCNERKEAVGLVYSNPESLRVAVEETRGVYFSRKRGFWRKGESSGATQELLKIEVDCDSDALRFTVKQRGDGFCHNNTPSCWGEDGTLSELEHTLFKRKLAAPTGSYSAKLFEDPELLNEKIIEEATELARASSEKEIASEAADLIFMLLAKLTSNGLKFEVVEDELKLRQKKIRRRGGEAKVLNRSAFEAAADTSGISRRVKQITVSAIKQMPLLARAVPEAVSIGQGVPSLVTPPFIVDNVVEQLKENSAIGKYSLQPGIAELRQAVARDLSVQKGIPLPDFDREIFITCGGMEALATTLTTIVDKYDEVILCSPGYSSHIEQVLFAEGVPKFVALDEQNGWSVNPNDIRKAITPKTKAIILANPSNPTGMVISKEIIDEIVTIALEAGIFVVADETYDFLTYNDSPYVSLCSYPDLKDQLILCGSFSKRFCMTGWRVGFMLGPERIVEQALKVHDAFAICAPTISQYAALAALNASQSADGPGTQFVNKLRRTLQSRRDLMCSKLAEMPELFTFSIPQGAYYVLPKVIDKNLSSCSSIELARRLLYEAKVVTVPGSAFGPEGEGHLRMSFSGNEEDIEEALNRIKLWRKKL